MTFNIKSEIYRYIPLVSNTKRPLLPDWPNNGVSLHDIDQYGAVPEAINVGILTGSASYGLVDIDLDGPNTIAAGALLLPETNMVMGRNSRPASHYFYRVEGDTASLRLKNPNDGQTLVEFRGNGCQTMMPPSIHPDNGEMVRFEEGRSGRPASCDRETLLTAIRQIATVSFLSAFWIERGRHKLAMQFAGLCACSGVDRKACEKIIGTLCSITEDEEREDRLLAVATSYDRYATKRQLEWRSKLVELFGSNNAVECLIEWMEGNRSTPSFDDRDRNIQTVSVVVDTTTDISTAEAFHASTSETIIYGEYSEKFYKRNSAVYDPITIFEVKGEIIDFLKTPTIGNAANDPTKLRASQSNARINAVLELAKTFKRKDDREFDRQSYLLGTKNGVLDLARVNLVDPNDIVTKRIGADFRLAAKCPLFLKFVGEIFEDNPEVIPYLQRAVGYTLTASVEAQAMFILIGTGANGKSVFLNLLQALMGDYGTSLPPHSIMQTKFGNDKTDDLASLDGKRFVFATEGEAGDRLASAKVKRMTGGDMMSVKRLYKDYFNLKPEFKMWFGSNELPRIAGNDDAIWRRLHLIEFKRTFTPAEQDPRLLEKLKGELPGILNWALEGLRQIGEMKGDFLAPPDSVRKALNAYRNENDNVGEFIAEACIRDGASRVMAGELYNHYVSYSSNSGVEPMNQIAFSRSLNNHDIGIKKTSKGNARTGIRLK
ncbi:phage/plasmid primase, P4 family [Methylobacterium fujisawaense]|uniref:phage/plasmid primase, P4 family n=1 Tax=Methylobacterium fujisawaense TaxID=107400 RepID=UPI003CF5F387